MNVTLLIFHTGLEDLLILKGISEAPISHCSDPSLDPIHLSHLNNILMFYNCVSERLILEVALRYWSCVWIKISSFGSKVSLYFVDTEKWQLRWIRTLMIFSLFGSKLGLLHLHDYKEGCIWRKLYAWILWGNVLRSKIGKTESGGGVR